VVVVRGAARWARAPVAAPAEIADAFGGAGRHRRQAGKARTQSVDQPVREGAARRVRVEHLNGQLLGAGWRRAPLQAGEPAGAVAGELARECTPGKVRT
jgi:hypothetical protein